MDAVEDGGVRRDVYVDSFGHGGGGGGNNIGQVCRAIGWVTIHIIIIIGVQCRQHGIIPANAEIS